MPLARKSAVARPAVPDATEMSRVQEGDVLVTDMTDPDWEPVMKRASAIVTNRGGRTCHAAIVARELGIPAVVGCGNATERAIRKPNVSQYPAQKVISAIFTEVLSEIEVTDLTLGKDAEASRQDRHECRAILNWHSPFSAYPTMA